MSLHFVTIGVSTRCPKCSSQLPIDGPMRLASCRRCGHVVQIEPSDWAYALRCAYEGIVCTTGTQRFSFTYPKGGLPCPICGFKISLGELPTSFDGGLDCPQCSTPFEVFPPPPWLSAKLPQVLQIYAAARDSSSMTPPPEPRREPQIAPVSLTCPNCDAIFTVPPDSDRCVSCDQCHAELLIPDEEWFRMRPLGKVRLWAFCLDADMGFKIGDEEPSTPHFFGSVSREPAPENASKKEPGVLGDGFNDGLDALLTGPTKERREDFTPVVIKASSMPPAPQVENSPLPSKWPWTSLGFFFIAIATLAISLFLWWRF